MTNPETSIKINNISTGFIDIPNKISINLYAQGCKRNCPGCHNPNSFSFDGGYDIFISDIESIIEEYELADWICWLGGDAIYQQKSLKIFNSEFKKYNKKIALYTGELFENINKELLKNLDLVIDGEWKGKPITDNETNQRIWLKTNNEWILIFSWDLLDLTLNNEV